MILKVGKPGNRGVPELVETCNHHGFLTGGNGTFPVYGQEVKADDDI